MFLNFFFGCIFIVIGAFIIDFSQVTSVPNFKGIFGAVYVGIFEMGITFVIWLKALNLSKTTAQVSNFIYSGGVIKFTPCPDISGFHGVNLVSQYMGW